MLREAPKARYKMAHGERATARGAQGNRRYTVDFLSVTIRYNGGLIEASVARHYEEFTPRPLCAARAKGRRFDPESRRRAGLSEAFIEHVRNARPPAATRDDE